MPDEPEGVAEGGGKLGVAIHLEIAESIDTIPRGSGLPT